MIYYIVNESFTNIIAFVSILFAFAFTIAAIALGKNLLPRDAGRAYAINGSKSVGKPRGAGMIFILTFTVTCALFVNLSAELIIYLILVLAAMLSGYLDDSASSPWGNLKKGLIDLAISVMAAVTYLHYNPNTFDLAFFGKTVTLNPIIYAILIIILIWVSINVTNCSDGVDGLCGTLSVVTLASVYVLFKSFNIESAYRHTVLIMIVCILGYLWFNASPSKLLMGDAGSESNRNIYSIYIPQAPCTVALYSNGTYNYSRWRTWSYQGFIHEISSHQPNEEPSYTNPRPYEKE